MILLYPYSATKLTKKVDFTNMRESAFCCFLTSQQHGF